MLVFLSVIEHIVELCPYFLLFSPTRSKLLLKPKKSRRAEKNFYNARSLQDNNRDLKHQDGRWRRGRHIRVKAEARPASRFTHLSMLSNNATATSRQFLEKISPRKYLENKSSFAIARGELLVAFD